MLLSISATPSVTLAKLKSIILLTITACSSIPFVYTTPLHHSPSTLTGDIFTTSNLHNDGVNVPTLALSDDQSVLQDNAALNFLLSNDDDNINSASSATSQPELNDREINLLTNILLQILEEPWRDDQLPLLYVEEYPPPPPITNDDIDLLDDDLIGNTMKRSRYYRKYPWKRQNSRSRMYDAENKYMCQPSREDVYQLLLALHESRQGNRNRTVNFCNRRRPAAAIYTNIRFLGRR